MPRMDVAQMPFAKLYPLLVNKATKKGRTQREVDQIITWLTGYSGVEIARLAESDTPTGRLSGARSAVYRWKPFQTRCSVRAESWTS